MSYIKKEDLVIAIAGKDKGKSGKVLKIFSSANKAIVENINMVKKHRRRRKQEEPGGILEIESPINMSNLLLHCPKCKEGVRVNIERTEKKIKRICKKCKSIL